jgi:hypothetical protein
MFILLKYKKIYDDKLNNIFKRVFVKIPLGHPVYLS